MGRDPRALLRQYGLTAKKSWGQNFLVDERTYRSIVDAADPDADDWVIEIGAGLGTLTERLAERAARVVAVERDRDMVAVLRAELGSMDRVEIADANALTFDYAEVGTRAGRRPIVVGNLPYQIATPLLFRLVEARRSLGRIVVMLQKEMAERIVARPGTSEYGALTVMLRVHCEASIVCRVGPGSFVPSPRVASAVLRLEPRGDARSPVEDLARFRDVVRAAFGQRRKTLRNALRSIAAADVVERALSVAAIDGQLRGETLDVPDFARLALAFAGAEGAGSQVAPTEEAK